MQQKTRLLLLTALVLVAATWLATDAWRSRPADPDESATLERQSERNLRSMQDALADDVAERTGSEEQERIDSPRGQALFRRCADWTDLYERAPTEENRAGRDEACTTYRRYVMTGEGPE